MPTQTAVHVRRLFDLANLDAQALDLFRASLRLTARNRVSWPTHERVQRWTAEQLQRLGIEADQALTDERVLDMMAGIHVVAGRVPAQVRRRSAFGFHNAVAAVLDSIEPDFLDELLKETRRREKNDPAFAAELAQSRRAVASLQKRASAIQTRVVESVPADVADDPDLPVVLAREEDSSAEVAIGVFVVLLVVVVTIWYIANSDPSKDGEGFEEDDE